LVFSISLAVYLLGCSYGCAQSTTFLYQGRLQDSLVSANGLYDMTFALYTNSAGGTAVAPVLTNTAVVVGNGVFGTALDFGSAFDGSRRWLEIGVRSNGNATDFVILSPRQEITATPYALFSRAVSATGITGTIPDAQLSANVARLSSNAVFTGVVQFSNPSNVFIGQFTGDGSAVSNFNAANLVGSLTTTNPAVRGTITYGTDIASMTEYVTNNLPASPVSGMVRRCLYPPFDAQHQTNWCLVLRSAIHLAGEYSMAVEPTGWPTDMPTEYVFGVDGTSFIVYLRGNGSYMGVEVDGADDWSRTYTSPDGNFHYYTISFNTPARRQIALKLGSNHQFGGIYLPATNGLWPGVLPKQHRMIVVGDSFSEDSGSSSWPSCLMTLFQNVDVWSSAVGATGYINNGTSTRTNFQGRIFSDVISNAPEYVLFAGGINDSSMMTNSAMSNTLYGACLSVYQTTQAALPSTKIIALGPFWPRTPNPSDPAFQANAAISNACFSAGIATNYIDTLSDPWVTGVWNQPGSGNAVNYTSSDGTHPTLAGAWNLAYHVASQLARRFPELQPRAKTR
jgi:hypothetical protein